MAKITVTSAGNKVNIATSPDMSMFYTERSREWAISDKIVNNEDYSSKYYAQISKNKTQEVVNSGNKALSNINTTKNNAISEMKSQQNTSISAMKSQQNTSVNSVASTGNSYIKTFNNYKIEINTEKENAKDFYQKAVGWNIQYETDGEEDCLVFKDRTDEEINQAKNYIEDTRDKVLTSIETAKTSALNSIESTRSSVVSSVTTAGTSALSNISSAKTSAINEVNNAKTTTITNAQNSAINSINTAKTEAVNTINSAKISAVNACAEQVALAKEYAQMANGWDFSYDEENEMLVFVENV